MRIPALAFAVLMGTVPCLAQPAEAPPAPRYSFVPVEGGALKLDRDTGKVSFCGRLPAGYGCEAVPDTRDAYEAEIVRLQQQVQALQGQPAASLPDASQLDAAMDYAERLMRRLKQMIDGLQRPNPADPT